MKKKQIKDIDPFQEEDWDEVDSYIYPKKFVYISIYKGKIITTYKRGNNFYEINPINGNLKKRVFPNRLVGSARRGVQKNKLKISDEYYFDYLNKYINGIGFKLKF